MQTELWGFLKVRQQILPEFQKTSVLYAEVVEAPVSRLAERSTTLHCKSMFKSDWIFAFLDRSDNTEVNLIKRLLSLLVCRIHVSVFFLFHFKWDCS